MGKSIISKPPGIEDIFPDDIPKWNFVHQTARDVFRLHNYREIIVPIIEYTEVFSRGLGTETDIVSKEMFSFEDRGGRNITLRPEGTASVVRAYVENGEYNRLSTCKFFYAGPMFRAEKPQKGRQRQFHQLGAEIFGSKNPYYDFEIISMMYRITERLRVPDFTLLLNSIGCPECRAGYVKNLKEYFSEQSGALCGDCKKRLDKNPLRLLDCKNITCAGLKKNAPKITSYLCAECGEHYSRVKEYLNNNNLEYTEDPYLVRGLDYYTRTTFEFVSGSLGGQNAFAAGGRYDSLVETFGGNPAPAVGFAAGIERILLMIEESKLEPESPDVFIVYSGEEAFRSAMDLSNMLRENNISCEMDPDSKGFKAQFKKADRENSKIAVIIGENEIAGKKYTVKSMKSGEQQDCTRDNIIGHINTQLKTI